MITITQTSESTENGIIVIGRQGEHGVRQVEFDLSYLVSAFGSGTAVLVHKRANEDAPYACPASQEGNTLTWVIGDTDTAYEGFGRCEIRWTVNENLAKTVVFKTRVLKSITAETEIPDPYESWYDSMINYIDTIKVSAAQVEQAVIDAEDAARRAQQSA